jgi:hypothetical protein
MFAGLVECLIGMDSHTRRDRVHKKGWWPESSAFSTHMRGGVNRQLSVKVFTFADKVEIRFLVDSYLHGLTLFR